MLNNAKLKETLSQKVTATTADTVQNRNTGVAERTAEEMLLPSLTVVLTFSLSIQDAPSQMKRISEMVKSLGLLPMVQPQSGPVVTSVPKAIPVPVQPVQPVQPIPPVRSQVPAKPITSTARMTDKQKRMIFALIARKNLSPESVSEILEREFGHSDGARLSKPEASRLIDLLMSSK